MRIPRHARTVTVFDPSKVEAEAERLKALGNNVEERVVRIAGRRAFRFHYWPR